MSSTFSSSSLMLTGAAWPAAQPQMSKSSRGPSGPWRRCPPRSWCPPTCPRRQPDALTNISPRRHHDSARLPCQRVDQQLRTPPGAQTLMREVASARIVRPAFVRDHGHVLPVSEFCPIFPEQNWALAHNKQCARYKTYIVLASRCPGGTYATITLYEQHLLHTQCLKTLIFLSC